MKINGQLFFVYNQIANILETNCSHNSTKIYYLIKSNDIKAKDIILLEDKNFIKNNIIYGYTKKYIYPTFTQLISVNGVLDYCKHYILTDEKKWYQKDEKKVGFLLWFWENYNILRNRRCN